MVVETWLTPQNDRKTANYTYATTESAPKMPFSNISGPYMVKF